MTRKRAQHWKQFFDDHGAWWVTSPPHTSEKDPVLHITLSVADSLPVHFHVVMVASTKSTIKSVKYNGKFCVVRRMPEIPKPKCEKARTVPASPVRVAP